MWKMILLTLFVAAPMSLSAQKAGALRAGVRVQVTPVNGKPTAGDVTSLSADSISWIQDDPGATRSTLAVTDVKSVRVSKGRSYARGALLGGVIGITLGVAGGALLGATTYSKNDCSIIVCNRSSAAAFGGFGGGLLGVFTGTLVGAMMASEQWETVDFHKR